MPSSRAGDDQAHSRSSDRARRLGCDLAMRSCFRLVQRPDHFAELGAVWRDERGTVHTFPSNRCPWDPPAPAWLVARGRFRIISGDVSETALAVIGQDHDGIGTPRYARSNSPSLACPAPHATWRRARSRCAATVGGRPMTRSFTVVCERCIAATCEAGIDHAPLSSRSLPSVLAASSSPTTDSRRTVVRTE